MKQKILTFLIRWYSISDRSFPRWLQRACDRNAQLRQERDKAQFMTRQLRSESVSCPDAPSSDLVDRIMENFEERSVISSNNFSSFLKPLSLAAVACIAFLLIWQFALKEGSNDKPEATIVQHQPEGIDDEKSFVFTAKPLLEKKQWSNPLDQEMEYVLEDTKSAIGFLAKNFLPSEMLGNLKTRNPDLKEDV